jgi:hypothetical protein
MGNLQHDPAAYGVNAINHLAVSVDQFIAINHRHVIQGALADLRDAGISGNDQANAAFDKTLVELKLFFRRATLLIGQSLMGSRSNHPIAKFHVPD